MPCLSPNISVTVRNVAEIFGGAEQCYIFYRCAEYEARTCTNMRERRQPRAPKNVFGLLQFIYFDELPVVGNDWTWSPVFDAFFHLFLGRDAMFET